MKRSEEAGKRPQPNQLEEARSSERAHQPEVSRETAWDLWRDHAREDLDMSNDDKALMLERHKLVVSIIDVNSRQLRCDSARAGLDIERACALRDAGLPDQADDAKARLEVLDRRMANLMEEQQKLISEREFLDSALEEFDTAAPVGDARVGRA